MKKKLLYTGLILTSAAAVATDEIFDVTMKLLAPITITELTSLVFPNTQAGVASDVVVATADAGAASFSATGSANVAYTASVVETSIVMQKDGNSGGDAAKEIVVDTFSVDQGAGTFDGSGNATGLKAGATAHVLVNDIAGDYSSTATFRVVYQ